MWIYVPTSTSSACAPEVPDSISESSWQFQTLAASCSWRGKPSPSLTWSKRWNKVAWLRRLSGRMCKPSAADHGVGWWMASLAAYRANRILSQENNSAKKTSATSGRQPGASSSNRVSGSSSSKTSKACSTLVDLNGSVATFDAFVSRLRSDYSARANAARRINAKESSFSPWPTPAARDYKGTNGPDHLENGTGRQHMDQLPNFVAYQWATPTASENSNRTTKMAPSHGNGHGIVLAGQASDFSRQVPQISTDGETPSIERRSLNPLFVEWLMGWPHMWTAFECSATVLSAFKLRMRFALSQLALPAEIPVQNDLFA
jgi:hypothetical protein